jgi:hypothetical protein
LNSNNNLPETQQALNIISALTVLPSDTDLFDDNSIQTVLSLSSNVTKPSDSKTIPLERSSGIFDTITLGRKYIETRSNNKLSNRRLIDYPVNDISNSIEELLFLTSKLFAYDMIPGQPAVIKYEGEIQYIFLSISDETVIDTIMYDQSIFYPPRLVLIRPPNPVFKLSIINYMSENSSITDTMVFFFPLLC